MMPTNAIPSRPRAEVDARDLRASCERHGCRSRTHAGSVAPLIREAMTLDNIADALVRHATVHGCAGDQAVACRLRRMGRELRIKAMLKRGHAAVILGHELPTAGVR